MITIEQVLMLLRSTYNLEMISIKADIYTKCEFYAVLETDVALMLYYEYNSLCSIRIINREMID